MSSLLRFSYYGNFGFGLLAFSLGFLLALFQLKEPKKEKSDGGPGEGENKKLVSLENLTNSFKVLPNWQTTHTCVIHFQFMCKICVIISNLTCLYKVLLLVMIWKMMTFQPGWMWSMIQFLHQGFGEEEIRQPAPHRHSPCRSFHGQHLNHSLLLIFQGLS